MLQQKECSRQLPTKSYKKFWKKYTKDEHTIQRVLGLEVSPVLRLSEVISQADCIWRKQHWLNGVIPKTLMPREITGVTVEVKAVADMHQRKAEMAKHTDALIDIDFVICHTCRCDFDVVDNIVWYMTMEFASCGEN
ncbi:hypothetical protein V2J09_008970 [Rumex salicifolius]